jgi:hypothetical protein
MPAECLANSDTRHASRHVKLTLGYVKYTPGMFI